MGTDERTNERGANAVANVFPEYNVTPIKMRGDIRLKSLVCMAGRDIIACGNSPQALNVLKVSVYVTYITQAQISIKTGVYCINMN